MKNKTTVRKLSLQTACFSSSTDAFFKSVKKFLNKEVEIYTTTMAVPVIVTLTLASLSTKRNILG